VPKNIQIFKGDSQVGGCLLDRNSAVFFANDYSLNEVLERLPDKGMCVDGGGGNGVKLFEKPVYVKITEKNFEVLQKHLEFLGYIVRVEDYNV